jgi:nucleotide-binding universal stress UspA family protein
MAATLPMAEPRVGRGQLPQGPVVVGVDGSVEGRLAARVAAFEANHRGADLHLVHVARAQLAGCSRAASLDPLPRAARLARATLGPESALHIAPRTGPAAEVLQEVGRDAALLVLGSHPAHLWSEFVTGSVSRALLGRSGAPLVLVHTLGAALVDGAPVVFGATDSAADRVALAFARAEARLRRTTLLVADATRGGALIEAADAAGLLVIGHPRCRAHDAAQASCLRLLRHAPCPVAVVPTEP